MNSLELPQILYQPFAATGDKNTILNSPSTEDPQRANLQTGFPAITQIPIDNGGIPPERLDFNGLGYLLSSFYFFTQCGGVYTFNQDVSNAIGGYPLGAVLYYTDSDGTMYKVRSLLENNTYNFVSDPSYIDGEHWEYVSENALGKIYPIGSIYIGTQSTCPMASLIAGSQWELVAQDRALWGGDGTNANTTIAAGLPNITGKYNNRCLQYGNDGDQEGALYHTDYGWKQAAGGTDWSGSMALAFDASRSNSIYGSSSTVQPPAYRVNIWRRTA